MVQAPVDDPLFHHLQLNNHILNGIFIPSFLFKRLTIQPFQHLFLSFTDNNVTQENVVTVTA